jgi:hypothetical protein
MLRFTDTLYHQRGIVLARNTAHDDAERTCEAGISPNPEKTAAIAAIEVLAPGFRRGRGSICESIA